MANDKTLFDWVEDRKSTLEEMEQTDFFALPEFVSNNLKYPFFEWQKSALENFVIFDRTSKLKDFPDIKTLFDELCERYFLKYNVSVNEFSQIIQEPEFQSLPLDEQKQMVLEMLDLNQMYVSLSEMDDEQFAGCLNDDDKALSREFYQSAKNQAEKKDGE